MLEPKPAQRTKQVHRRSYSDPLTEIFGLLPSIQSLQMITASSNCEQMSCTSITSSWRSVALKASWSESCAQWAEMSSGLFFLMTAQIPSKTPTLYSQWGVHVSSLAFTHVSWHHIMLSAQSASLNERRAPAACFISFIAVIGFPVCHRGPQQTKPQRLHPQYTSLLPKRRLRLNVKTSQQL